MGQKRLEDKIEIDASLRDIGFLGDSDRLTQILVNLLANSLKYTDQGHIKLIARDVSQDR